MSIIEHILLFSFLLCLFYVWGKYFYNITPANKFWLHAVVPISLYSLIVGSRYGWGPDYLFYKYRLEHAFTFEEEQWGFKWLNQAISGLGLNYVAGYIIYSFIFIVCAFLLIRSFGKISKYMYAFIIPASLQLVSNGIRQGVALSFILLALYFFNKKNWWGLAIAILIGVSIHTATLITAVIIAAIYFISKKPISWKISIPLYLFFTFLFDVSKIGFIAEYMQYLTLGNKFQSYVDNADEWFGEDAAEQKYAQGPVALVLSSLFYIGIIYLGYVALKIKNFRGVTYLYNTVVIGVIFYRAVFLYEILRRIAEPMVLFYFVILGYIFLIYEKKNRLYRLRNIGPPTFSLNNAYTIWVGFIFLYLFTFWGRFILLFPSGNFFWNK